MPKIKTNSGAKRGSPLPEQENQEKHAFKSHILTRKTKKQKEILLTWER